VLGNLLVQARALGDLPPGVSVRDASRRSPGSPNITHGTVRPTAALLLSLSDTGFR
jgi:hypothetical protein